MSKRKDIIDGKLAKGRKYGLIYTKKCGWIDLGHANPAGGASTLWENMINEKSNDILGKLIVSPDYFFINYSQMMGNKYVKFGRYKRYQIKRGLTLPEKKTVALAIFFAVSKEFELLQENWFWSNFTDSGFSVEDLVSNLVGFYRAIDPGTDYIDLCDPVRKDVALGVWDKYGAVGAIKNYSFAPCLYPIPGSKLLGPICAPLPGFLNKIKPATQSPSLFLELK